jgi:hypothetical protein
LYNWGKLDSGDFLVCRDMKRLGEEIGKLME